MGTQRDHYEEWFATRRGPRYPADEAAALAAADAYDAIGQAGKLSQTLVDVLVGAASSARGLVWNCGVDLLRKAMQQWPEIAGPVSMLLRSSRANVRFSAMCCVRESMPRETAAAMVRAGLNRTS